MDAKTLLGDVAKAGVYQLDSDARQLAQAAAEAGLAVFRIDIGRAHDKQQFLEHVSKAMQFPETFGRNWDALADSLRDLSWIDGKGYVVILEKSKHFCDAHRHEFEEAVDVLREASDFWKGEGRPFWGLIAGPDGWKSGWPAMPAG